MSDVEKLVKMRALYDEGILTGHELALAVIRAILEGEISEFEKCKNLVSPDIRDVMLPEIEAIEANGCVIRNPFARDGLTEAEKIERASRLKPTYEAIFAQIKSYLGGEAVDAVDG